MEVRQRLRALAPAHVVSLVAAAFILVASLWVLMTPVFADVSRYGRHDWDAALSFRYATVLALRRYHELPWYNPWFCGGFPSWAFTEAAENVVSPFLPLYLLLPFNWACRLEVLGSAVLAAVFTYLAASRVTRSVAIRAAIVPIAALNGRWTLQIGAGHFWHLQYMWLPLAYYFFDRAIRERRQRYLLATAATLAIMPYLGAIYPLPHAVLFLGGYALVACLELRSLRPLAILAGAGAISVGLAAPKLFPMLALIRRFPRLIDSTETLDLSTLVTLLTSRDQDFAPKVLYGWHEWGMYVGWAGVAVLAVAVVFGQGMRDAALRFVGLAFCVLAFGAFSPSAPWVWLHGQPMFSSQHVPSRFLYPGVVALSLLAASVLGRWLDRAVVRWRWLDVLMLIPVAWLAMDIAKEGRHAIRDVLVLGAPEVPEEEHFAHTSAPKYDYSEHQWSGATLLLMKQNLGRMQSFCYGLPDYGAALKKGAVPRESPTYRGEAYLATGGGEARVVRWSPSSADVAYHDASPGALVVYNMNWDPDWRANGSPAVSFRDAVATPVPGGEGVVHFVFYPGGLNVGLLVFAVTLAGLGALFARGRASRVAMVPP